MPNSLPIYLPSYLTSIHPRFHPSSLWKILWRCVSISHASLFHVSLFHVSLSAMSLSAMSLFSMYKRERAERERRIDEHWSNADTYIYNTIYNTDICASSAVRLLSSLQSPVIEYCRRWSWALADSVDSGGNGSETKRRETESLRGICKSRPDLHISNIVLVAFGLLISDKSKREKKKPKPTREFITLIGILCSRIASDMIWSNSARSNLLIFLCWVSKNSITYFQTTQDKASNTRQRKTTQDNTGQHKTT